MLNRPSVLMLRCLTAGLAVAMLLGVIPSCHRRAPAPPALPPSVEPATAGEVVRVRLEEAVEAVQAGTTGAYRLKCGADVAASPTHPLTVREIRRSGDEWIIGQTRLAGGVLELSALADSLLIVDGRYFRGALLLRPVDARRFAVDNHLPLESYLAGVLARELPRLWHPEAYKAQAVAARTYVLYEMRHAGRSRTFDVYDDQRSQVYGGVADETDKSLAAVRATAAQVLVVGTPPNERTFKASYSSTCGGLTNPADALEAQAESVAPLAGGVICTDCSRASRYRWPAVQIPKPAVYQALVTAYPGTTALGRLEQVRVLSVTAWGRPLWVEMVGQARMNERLRADDLRLALLRFGPPEARALYSMNCAIRDAGTHLVFEDGRGFGHGVGMCQYGAQGKALRGMKYHEILYAYYPGAHIASVGR